MAFTRKANSERSADRGVLVIEVLLADQINDCRDRRHALTQPTWHRPNVVLRHDIRLRHAVQDYATSGRSD